jgi:DNA-binding XRE family transcriptional regulator
MGSHSQRSPIRRGRGHFQLDWIAPRHAMQETGFTMNSIARRTKHPDHGLRAVPSIDLTDGVNLAHQFALDGDTQLHLFGGSHHSADPWKSAHQAALIGLSHLFPRLVHSVSANVVSGDKTSEESDHAENCVVVSKSVADEEAAYAHQGHVKQSVGVSHGSGDLGRNDLFVQGKQSSVALGHHVIDVTERDFRNRGLLNADAPGDLNLGPVALPQGVDKLFGVHFGFLHDYCMESSLNMQQRLDVLMDTLAKRAKAARLRIAMRQEDLAKLSGVKQSDISKIENGRILKTTSVVPLARALGCDPDWLATGEGSMVSEKVWPFTLVTPGQIQQLRPKHLQMVQKFTLDLLESQDLTVVSGGAQANTSGKRSIEAGIIQLKTTRKKIAKRVPNDGEKRRNL